MSWLLTTPQYNFPFSFPAIIGAFFLSQFLSLLRLFVCLLACLGKDKCISNRGQGSGTRIGRRVRGIRLIMEGGGATTDVRP